MSHELIDKDHQPIENRNGPLVTRIAHEWRTLSLLGAPILIGQFAQMANGVIDTIMAGRASAFDLTGVAIGNSLWAPIFLFMTGLLNATQPVISGYRGAKAFNKIIPVTWNAIFIALIAALITVALLHNVEPILNLINMEEVPAKITIGYLNAFSWGVPAALTLVALRGLTDGLGHTKIFMTFSILSACINAPLNYILIFGKFGLPEFGGIGCGIATAIANWISLVCLLVYLNRAKAFNAFHLWQQKTRPNRQIIKTLLKLGVPIGFTIFVEVTMFSVVALLLAPFGAEIVAGHQIALNVVSILFSVPLSLGFALTLRISFLEGASEHSNARLVARSSILLVLGIALFYAGMLFTFAHGIAALYTNELAVIEVATLLLGFGAMFQIADVIQVVCISTLRGYRDTKIPMIIMLSSFWGIGIPLGYILANKSWILPAMGASGFWVGLIAGLTHAAFWLLIRLFHFTR